VSGTNGNDGVKGAVRMVDQTKGFGFIRADNGTDYFFHRSTVTQVGFETIRQGDRVFLIPGTAGEKGERVDQVWPQ
jgi:CspA family cold shock protein